MKRVLLIMPQFYGYEKRIISGLNNMGYEVAFIDYWGWTKTLRLRSVVRNSYYNNRLFRVLKKMDIKQFDKLLVIKGETLTIEHLKYLKKENPSLQCIMYQWDSIANFDYTGMIGLFDSVYTFDPVDAKSLFINYLPLFHTGDVCDDMKSKSIDLLLVGVFQKHRYEQAVNYDALCHKYKIRLKSYIYTPPTVYIKELLKGHVLSLRLINFFPISQKHLHKLYRKSSAFIDIVPTNQSGLSMRCIESYGLNKKLLMSNPSIIEHNPVISDIVYLGPRHTEDEFISFINASVPIYTNKDRLSLEVFLKTLID